MKSNLISHKYIQSGKYIERSWQIKEAELSYRKAIELNPDLAEAHSNLGNTLRDLGKLQDAEISLRKAIELNPNFAKHIPIWEMY